MKLKRYIVKTMCILLLCGTVITSSGCSKEVSDGKGYLFNYTMMKNPQNLDPQIATDSNSITIINSIFTGLMEQTSNGTLDYGIAQSYSVDDDGLRYIFTLRNDCKWYTNGGAETEVTAYDFEFAFKRMFNTDTHSPYGKKFSCLKNAQSILNQEDGYTYDDLGVYASDKYTLVFLLDYPNPEFLNLLSQSYAMPCNEAFFNSTHAMYGLYDYATISNGAYYIKQWFYDKYGKENFITLDKNPVNPDIEEYNPYAVNIIIDENTTLDDIEQSFYKSQTDLYYTNSVDKSSINGNDTVKYYDISTVGMIFNVKDQYFSNATLRNAFAYGINRGEAIKDTTSDISIALGIVPSGCQYNGQSYRGLVVDNSVNPYITNQDSAKSCYSTALQELDLNGLSTVRLIMESGSVDSSYIKSIIDAWEKLFNITVIVDPLSSEEYQKALVDEDYQIAVYRLTSEDDRPYSFMSNFISDNNSFGYDSTELDNLLISAQQSKTTDTAISYYSQAEKSILEKCIFVPIYHDKTYLVCGEGIDDILYNPFNNTINFNYGLNYSQES